ncbi:taste receptor type 2 member 1 [Prionailurus viverrinus]|uniref:taste receptor type 2 member 1 n=1 Tax=Prionailurus viverrinus TaxID=61388 RepID=UPI001FF6FBFC|nr:taste receptor type 2 member 1 [Prionailurus viverrinus]
MLDFYLIIHFLLPVIQCLIGVLANGIIVIVNGIELTKKRKMIPLDLLLSCLAISRICLQSFIFYINLVILSLIDFLPLVKNFAVFMFVNETGLWLATWLGVFYCAKISPIAHPLFFWLKRRISKLVPWLIIGSLLFASIPLVFYSKHTWVLSQEVLLRLFSPNATTQIKETSALQIVFLARFSPPFVIFLISTLLLVFSLGRHTWQMRNTVTGTRDSSTGVHVSALLSILSFLVLYLSHYMTAALLSSHIFELRSFMFLFCILVFGSYPSGHSIILISGNPKLKQNAKKFLLHGQCWQ